MIIIMLFTQLVETKSFVKTAEKLNMSKSTLSRKIKEVEDYYSQRLLIRDTRNVELTKYGEILYKHFKNLRQSLKMSYEEINPSDTSATGVLKIVLPTVLSSELISPYLSYFGVKYPNIKLDISFQHTPPYLKDGYIDIALTIHGTTQFDEMYESRFMRSEFIQFFCTPSYATKYGLPISINDLINHNTLGALYLDITKKFIIHTIINKYTGEEYLIDLSKTQISMDSPVHALKIGLQGEHIFWSWNSLCENHIKVGDLIPILPDCYAHKVDFYMFTKKKITPEAQLFIDFIYRCMNRSIEIDLQNM